MASNMFIPIAFKSDPRGLKQAEGSLKKFGKIAAGIGATIAGAFAVKAVFDFAAASVKAAEEVQKADRRLQNINKSMNLFGAETDNVSKRIKAYAEANEIATGTDAEVIKSAQAKLLTFANLAKTADTAGGAFDRATKATIDLAAAGFGSVESNAVKLGKALQDPVKGLTALGKAGVTFTDSEKEMIASLVASGKAAEAQDIILQKIEKRVAGTAEATATSSQKMKLAFENVKESVGAALLPVFEKLALALLPIVDKLAPILAGLFEALTPILLKVVDAVMPLAEKLMPVLNDLFAAIAPIIGEMIDALLPIIDAIFPTLVVLLEAISPILGIVSKIFKLFAPIIVKLIKATSPLVEAVLPILTGLLEALMPVFELLGNVIGFFVDTIITPLVEGLTAVVGWLGDLFGFNNKTVNVKANMTSSNKLTGAGATGAGNTTVNINASSVDTSANTGKAIAKALSNFYSMNNYAGLKGKYNY